MLHLQVKIHANLNPFSATPFGMSLGGDDLPKTASVFTSQTTTPSVVVDITGFFGFCWLAGEHDAAKGEKKACIKVLLFFYGLTVLTLERTQPQTTGDDD